MKQIHYVLFYHFDRMCFVDWSVGADSCGISESCNEEPLLRVQAKRYEQEYNWAPLISTKPIEIRPISIFVLRLTRVFASLSWRAPGTEVNSFTNPY